MPNLNNPGNGSKPKLSMPKIPVKNLKLHKCVNCSNTGFVEGVELRPVSKLISASGQNEIIQTKVPICSMCGTKVLLKDIFGGESELQSKQRVEKTQS